MTGNAARIAHWASITSQGMNLDGKTVFPAGQPAFAEFADAAYRYTGVAYPKFHKMDNLCKLGFLGAELLLGSGDWKQRYEPGSVGIVLANKSSSLDTDIRYRKMLGNGVASPAVFVYSLPNIVIGEISIRHGIKGENTFFVSDRYEIARQVEYVNLLVRSGVVDACICGWVELIGDSREAFIYFTGNREEGKPHTVEQIETYYNEQSNGNGGAAADPQKADH